ncbi:succinate-semialdehyde dehydrogenase/glutarate-semialdehyde dehydrogenase [Ochrobactrum daejeonense]|uniref:Succinate-semialdehyde dehydrogenase/glutarate-semialdehyde dehydrogenase n=1 Tax=Brucella daejeonensis TaxID=659015 RepID=A0A7W9ELR3_9HYPH|nr:NAD-dependent succinate-semialdehyde dehydrogenase [Brucella daejeonensis]MBB5701280.1 succinate-semialdehyde dehydrogenase/glutarate-semialdehyde dehydrogenase [Brucella daejeonensis]
MTFHAKVTGYADPALHSKGLYIGGAWHKGAGIPVIDPSTGNQLAEVADASIGDACRAVDAADAAAAGWRATPARQRAEILQRWFQLMTQHAEELATLIALENGKALPDARGEVAYAAEFFRWYAEEATRIPGEYRHTPSGSHNILVDHEPIGIAVLITPWNFPAAMATRKIGPALAAGCTVILKPASETPLTAYAMARLGEEAGVPAGVVNVLTTTNPGDVTNAMLADPRVRKLSFTGSTGVGRTLLGEAAKSIVSCSMELGGNAPFIVFDDADLEAALDGAMVAKMRNAGEACTAANRFYVQSGIHDAFVTGLTARMAALKIGPGYDPETQCGPMITQNAVRKIDRLVCDALAAGARATTGGKPLSENGYFYPPTVLENMPGDAAIAREEIFGPVAPIYKFESDDEAIRLANDTEYGLAAYIYSGDLKHALQVGRRLETGMLGINRGLMSDPAAPFGGVKQSGLGREGGVTGILEFMEAKYYAVDY